METQINLKMPPKLYTKAEKYMGKYGYRNMQELVYESVREKVFGRQQYDEELTEGEIKLIDGIISEVLKKRKLVGETQLRKALST
ncbi:MAG: hypothetical protein ABIG96_01055 [Candidatus Micrarchaeota archaeon]